MCGVEVALQRVVGRGEFDAAPAWYIVETLHIVGHVDLPLQDLPSGLLESNNNSGC